MRDGKEIPHIKYVVIVLFLFLEVNFLHCQLNSTSEIVTLAHVAFEGHFEYESYIPCHDKLHEKKKNFSYLLLESPSNQDMVPMPFPSTNIPNHAMHLYNN